MVGDCQLLAIGEFLEHGLTPAVILKPFAFSLES